jgi:hypothetical protein
MRVAVALVALTVSAVCFHFFRSEDEPGDDLIERSLSSIRRGKAIAGMVGGLA